MRVIVYPFLFILFSLLGSCRVDEFSPCEKAGGMEGLLCKEFRFENNVSIGYLACYYNADRYLSRKEYKSPEGVIKKYDLYEYDENLMPSRERSFSADGKLIREKKYVYNEQHLLTNLYSLEDGVEVSSTYFEYADTLLIKESDFNSGQLESYLVYQYYDGETNLYRTSQYSSAGVLLNYTNIEYFVNEYEKHIHYTGNNYFNGYDLYIFNAGGALTRLSVYNSTDQLVSYIEYVYNTDGTLAESLEYNEDDNLIKNSKFIYNK